MKRPVIIALEGIDGSGKTLQCSLLIDKLKIRGYNVETRSFPEYGSFFGKRVGELLHGETLRADKVDSKSMCLWYALDRWQSLKDAKIESDFLIINRYSMSNAVYQNIRDIDEGIGDIWPWVKELEHGQFGLPEPDAYILMDVLPDCAQRNVDAKAPRDYTSGRDVYEGQKHLLERARARYLDIAAREANVSVVECMQGDSLAPPEEISARVLRALIERGLVK